MDNLTRARLARLLDKLFDDDATKSKYHKTMRAKIENRKCMVYDDMWDRANVRNIIADVKSNKGAPGQKYGVIQENGVDVLILNRPFKVSEDQVYRKVMVLEESYEVLSKVHRELGHQGYKPLHIELRDKWTLPIAYVHALIGACNVCNILKNIQLISNVPATSENVEDKIWRFNLLDLEAECPYIQTPRYILILEDKATEFLILRPINDKTADTISDELIKVFFQFGAPNKITANATLIYEVLGPTLKKIVKIHPQFSSTTDDEKDSPIVITNSDIVDALKSWIEDIEISHYEIDCEIGCHVVQRRLNTRLRITHPIGGVKYTAFLPYNLFINHDEVISDLWDEEVMIREVAKPTTCKRKRRTKYEVWHKKPNVSLE